MAHEVQEKEQTTTPTLRLWKCKTCQFVVESEKLPFRCPRCGASRVKFDEISAPQGT